MCMRKKIKDIPGKEGKCIFNPFIIRIRREMFQTNIKKAFEIEITVFRAPRFKATQTKIYLHKQINK